MQSSWLPVSNADWLGTSFFSKFPLLFTVQQVTPIDWERKNYLNCRWEIKYNKTPQKCAVLVVLFFFKNKFLWSLSLQRGYVWIRIQWKYTCYLKHYNKMWHDFFLVILSVWYTFAALWLLWNHTVTASSFESSTSHSLELHLFKCVCVVMLSLKRIY